MVVDSSAIVAILLREDDADILALTLLEAPRRVVSSVSTFESLIVMTTRRGHLATAEVFNFLSAFSISVVPFSQSDLEFAIDAFDRYGKGRHPARLNFGDCISYAVACAFDEPLLFKGDDFSKTDIRAALP